jgi:phosphoadenosine phosphosulfate reductase
MLNDVTKTAAMMSDDVIVAFSGGKDSVAVLDLCCRHFSRVRVFFLYLVAGLSFQERVLRYYERRFGVEILRLPHFELSAFFRLGYFRAPDDDVLRLTITDIYNYVRAETGIWWIAAGERISDSVWRRAMIKRSGSIDVERGRVYPLAYWNKKHVESYLRQRKLPHAIESGFLKRGSSFGDFSPYSMAMVKAHFPGDYEKIKRWFPFIESAVKKYEIHGTKTGWVK